MIGVNYVLATLCTTLCPYLEVCMSMVVVFPLINAVHRHLLLQSFPAALPWYSQLAPRTLIMQKLTLRILFIINENEI